MGAVVTAFPTPVAEAAVRSAAAADSVKRDTLPDIASLFDTLPLVAADRADTAAVTDSVATGRDTLPAVLGERKRRGSTLSERVTFKQRDSLVYDVRSGNLNMYGNGRVEYTDLKVEAEHIKLNLDEKNVAAWGYVDTLSEKYVRPKFSQSDTEYELDSVRYNIDTKKALIWGGYTREGEGIISGGLVKKMPDDVLHMKGDGTPPAMRSVRTSTSR